MINSFQIKYVCGSRYNELNNLGSCELLTGDSITVITHDNINRKGTIRGFLSNGSFELEEYNGRYDSSRVHVVNLEDIYYLDKYNIYVENVVAVTCKTNDEEIAVDNHLKDIRLILNSDKSMAAKFCVLESYVTSWRQTYEKGEDK